MARHFTAASGEYVDFAPGDLATNDGGPSTVVILWRPTTVHAGWLLHAANAVNTQTFAINPYSDGVVWHTIGGTFHTTMAYTALDGWRLDLWTKPDGTGEVRGHTILLSGGGWAHTDYGPSADTSGVVPVTKARVGRHFVDVGALDGDVAAIAVVQANWGDAAIEAGNLTTGLSAWETLIGADPAVMWAFNQAAVTDLVLDLTGGGADESGRSGTTISTDPPGFSYLLGSVGVLDAGLPAVTAAVAGTATSGGLLAGALPAVTGQMAGGSTNSAVLTAVLPDITALFAQSVAISTPQVTATIRVRQLSATVIPG